MAEVSSNELALPQESSSGTHAQAVEETSSAAAPPDSRQYTASLDSAEAPVEPSDHGVERDGMASTATTENSPPSAQDTSPDSPSPAPSCTVDSYQAPAGEAELAEEPSSDGKVLKKSSESGPDEPVLDSTIAQEDSDAEAKSADKPDAEAQSASTATAVDEVVKEEVARESGDSASASQEETAEESQQPLSQSSIDADSSSLATTTAATRTSSSGSQPAASSLASLFSTLTFGRAPIVQPGKEDVSAKPDPGEEAASSAKEPLADCNSAMNATPAAERVSEAPVAPSASASKASTQPAPPSSSGGFTLFRSLQTQARHLVSQNKRRYQAGGYDLDLTYITENVIAMGFPAGDPSSGFLGLVEGLYRNHMDEVISFLETNHQGKYKVFNLCSERLYDAALFQGTVACFPFDDHNCPPLHLILAFCQSAHSWLRSGMDHVVVVHCKAGMGRTGIMIASLLLYLNYYSSSQEAIQYFNTRRAVDGKALVLPSQQRYVRYFERTLKGEPRGAVPAPRKCFLRGLRLHRCPYWIRPAVVVSDHSGVRFSTKTHPKTKNLSPEDYWYPAQQRKGVMVFALPGERCVAQLQGDFKISFLDRQGDFSCWLNANFLPTRQLLSTKDLDHFDKRSLVSPGFIVEVVVVDNDAPLPASAKRDPGNAPGSQGSLQGAPGTTATTAGLPVLGESSAGSAGGNGATSGEAPADTSSEGTPQEAEGAAGAVGEGAPSGASASGPPATGEPSSGGTATPAGAQGSSSSATSGVPPTEASAPDMGPSVPGESPSVASTTEPQQEQSQLSTFKPGAVPTTPSKGTASTAKVAAGEAGESAPSGSQSKSQPQARAQSQPALSLFSGTAKGVSGVGSTGSPADTPASKPQATTQATPQARPQATPPPPTGAAPATAQTAGHQAGKSQSPGSASSIASGPGDRGGGRAPAPGSVSASNSGLRVSGGSGGAGGSGGQSAMGFFQAFGDALFGPSAAAPPRRAGQASGAPGQGARPAGSARGSGGIAEGSGRTPGKEELQTSALTGVPSRERTFSGAKAANLEGWLSPSEAAAGAAKRDTDEPMLFFSDGMKFQAGSVTSPPGSRTAGATGSSQALVTGGSIRGGQQGGQGSVGVGRGSVGASGNDSFDTLPVFDTPGATSSPVMGPSADFAQAAASAADASMFTFGDEDDEVDFDGF